MVRKAEFDETVFIDATLTLIRVGGPTAVTMKAIARQAGAPTGSIYHRFMSRSALMGAVWVHCLSSLADHVLSSLKVEDVCDWVGKYPDRARLLMLYEENDIIEDALPTEIFKQLNQLHKDLGQGLSARLTALGKDVNPENMSLINFALFDGPVAALKPYLRGNEALYDKCCRIAVKSSAGAMELLE